MRRKRRGRPPRYAEDIRRQKQVEAIIRAIRIVDKRRGSPLMIPVREIAHQAKLTPSMVTARCQSRALLAKICRYLCQDWIYMPRDGRRPSCLRRMDW